MHSINENRFIGILIGIKKKNLLVYFKNKKIGTISRILFQKNRAFFIGQIITGKPETYISNLIRNKVTKQLKTNFVVNSNKYNWTLESLLGLYSKNFISKLLYLSYLYSFFRKKIGKFFEFKYKTSKNGFCTFLTHQKRLNHMLIYKIIGLKCMSL
jgi:hypothetical protein